MVKNAHHDFPKYHRLMSCFVWPLIQNNDTYFTTTTEQGVPEIWRFFFFFQNNELNIKVGANYFLSVHSLLQSYTTVLTSLSSPPVSPAAPPCRLPVRSLSSTQKGCWSPFLEDIPQSTGLPLCLHRTLCSGGCWSEERQDTHLFYGYCVGKMLQRQTAACSEMSADSDGTWWSKPCRKWALYVWCYVEVWEAKTCS